MTKRLIPHISAVLAFLLISVLYFMPQLEGKVIKASDTVQVKAMQQEVKEFQKETGEKTLWTNSMFGGMPTYHISTTTKPNALTYVKKIMTLGFQFPIGMFLLGMIGFYIMLLLLGVNPWLSLIGALFFGFSTNNLVLYEAGHTTKVATIMTSPLVISGMILLFRKKWMIGLSAFSLGMALNIASKHPQMTYYLGMVMAILVILYLVDAIKNKDLVNYAKSMMFVLLGVILGVGCSASVLWTTYEYSKDTMRGKPILVSESSNTNSSSEVEGLAWDYAMAWSNGTMDLFSSYIPKVVGGGSAETVSKNSNFGKVIKTNKDTQAPLYWGGLSSTAGPIYFGALVMFLFLFGAISVKSPVKWWLVLGVLLTLLMSMGKNFEILNRLFFDYLPWFNKFRTPNSVLSITVILMPILGILGIQQMVKSEDKKPYWKAALVSAGVLGGIALIFALLGGSMFDFSATSDARLAGMVGDPNQLERILDALYADRSSAMRSSSFRSLIIILMGLGMIWAYINAKISSKVLFALIGIIGLGDLLLVDARYVNHDDFVSQRRFKSSYDLRPVDKKILEDTAPYYRVHDLTADPFNSAIASYHHKTIGGYHPAKLQRYQDVIERYISKNNMAVLNMLNTKYFILPNQQGPGGDATYQLNPAALGNAWFVNSVQVVDNANKEIDALADLDPGLEAVIHKEFESYIKSNTYEGNGTITLQSYAPNKLSYTSDNVNNGFAVFSDIWFGPNKGWKAYVDGEEVEFVRANYLLRALNIPAGKHEIVFEFKPQSYFTGLKINYASSSIILLLLIYSIYKSFKREPEAS